MGAKRQEEQMPDNLTIAQLTDRLSNLVNQARGIEMAINGSSSLEPEEKAALSRLAETLSDDLSEIFREVREKHGAEQEGRK
jgi:hypothetical protein